MPKINKNKNKKQEKTIKEVCDIILSIEDKYDLFHMKIQNVYFWQLIRIYIYYEISRKIGVFGSTQQGEVTFKDKIFSFIPFIKNSLFSNPLSGNCHKDILIFDHPRKVQFEGEYQDIYSYFLESDLGDGGFSYEVIESPYLNKHYTSKKDYIKYNDRILLGSYIYKKRNKLNFSHEEKGKIESIEKEINYSFNIEIDLFNIIENHILDYKYQYKNYNKLFEKRTPNYVFVVVAYENQAMIAAAKNNNVGVIELQHGTISNYHLGYNYPNEENNIENNLNNNTNNNLGNNIKNNIKNNVEYFPDKILSFGDYWKNVANYPIDSKNIISIGFPYLEEAIKSYINNSPSKHQILFISQGVIGKYLSEFAYNLAKKLDDSYQIIYKLHPGEYFNWKNNYEYLNKCVKLANFTVIDNNNISLYELFSKSQYQIGVFSTAIYEGLLFNCKTFIVDLPGAEYMDNLVEKNYVKKIKDPDEFIDSIANFEINHYNNDFFFKKYKKSNLYEIIK